MGNILIDGQLVILPDFCCDACIGYREPL